jgi:hypothetical protein
MTKYFHVEQMAIHIQPFNGWFWLNFFCEVIWVILPTPNQHEKYQSKKALSQHPSSRITIKNREIMKTTPVSDLNDTMERL